MFEHPSRSGKRILLIDDDEDDYVLTRDLLGHGATGYTLEWAADFQTGLEAIARQVHDVYLLDMQLGAWTGVDLLRAARERGYKGPFLILTGQGQRAEDLEAMQAGAADFLEKSQLTSALLERSMRYAIEQHHKAFELERRVEERTAELARANELLREEAVERARAERRLHLALSAARMGTYEYNLLTGEMSYSSELGPVFGLPIGAQHPTCEVHLEAVHPDDRARITAACDACLYSGCEFDQEYRIVWPDGSIRWVSDRGQVFPDASGHPSVMAGVIRDITEKRLISEAQRLSEERFRLAAEAVNGIIYDCNLNTGIVERTRGLFEVLGYRPEEVPADRAWWNSLIHPEDTDVLTTALEQGERYMEEYRVRHREGHYVQIMDRGMIVRDEMGKIIRLVGCSQDISRLRSAERELRVSQERHDLVVQSVNLGLWYCDLPFDRLIWNSRCKEHFGLPADADVTIDLFWAGIHPDDRERTRLAIERSLQLGEPYDIEYRTVAPSGVERWIRAIGRGFRDQTGRATHFDGVTIEVTAQKKIEADLAESQRYLRERDRLKDEFLAMLAHELRNPLAPLRNALYLVRMHEASCPDQVRAAYDLMDRQLEHLVRLVDDLLDVSRITRGMINLQKEHTDLRQVLSRAVESSRPLLDARGHLLEVHLPECPLPLEGDPVRLAQVFLNLLTNAAKYTPRGGRIVLGVARQGNSAQVYIRDNGIGIPEGMLARIFELFAQVERTLDRSEGGLGIGLTLVKRLTEMHGGSVEAHSAGTGKGSEFMVRLPLLGEAQEAAEKATVAVQQHRSSRRRVLVVDDNLDAANSLAVLLGLLGHEARVAGEGKQALTLVLDFTPDVMILDLGMPVMSGFEVARQLRTLVSIKQPLLVALTGFGTEEDRRQTQEAGFDAHLVKPVDLGSLKSLLATDFPGG